MKPENSSQLRPQTQPAILSWPPSEIGIWPTIQSILTTNSRFWAYGDSFLTIKISGKYFEKNNAAYKAIKLINDVFMAATFN